MSHFKPQVDSDGLNHRVGYRLVEKMFKVKANDILDLYLPTEISLIRYRFGNVADLDLEHLPKQSVAIPSAQTLCADPT